MGFGEQWGLEPLAKRLRYPSELVFVWNHANYQPMGVGPRLRKLNRTLMRCG